MVTIAVGIIVCLWWLLSQKKKVTRDIVENVDETIVIFDKQDRPCYINLTAERSKTEEFLQSINREIIQSGNIPKELEPNTIYEGKMEPYVNDDTVLSWKMSSIIRDHKYYGRIFVFHDITVYAKLMKRMELQNMQLKDALEAQKEYTLVTAKLRVEEERERIMLLIDGIARDYLAQLNEGISDLEECTNSGLINDKATYESKSDEMIQITRDAIAKVRKTVKELRVST